MCALTSAVVHQPHQIVQVTSVGLAGTFGTKVFDFEHEGEISPKTNIPPETFVCHINDPGCKRILWQASAMELS